MHNNPTKSNHSPKPPNFITLYLKDEQDKAISNARVIIKGFKHNEALETINLKRKSDAQGKIRFDKEKYFNDCYSFKIKLDEKEAYFPTPLQNAKRIFNNYTNHREGLVLKFKAKDHLVYDGFNVYHYKGNDLIKAYMARSGTAKASNEKRSDKQIASCFYQGKKAYFYYDDESIRDKFGTLAEGDYYFKINEITKDTQPHFLKDYPFEMGRTWGKYCVRLYSDKESLQTKENLYLYSINDKGEFGSSGSIGMAQAELLENLNQQNKWIQDEKERIVSLRVKYPKKLNHKIVFVGKV